MPTPPQRPADAALLHHLRTRRDELLPEVPLKAIADKVARTAGYNFYPNKLRRIESGETSASDLDYAWVAWAVNATPNQVEEVGRPEAARLLREIIDKHSPKDTILSAVLAPDVTPDAVQKHLRQKLEEIRSAPNFTPEERASMEEFLIAQIELLLQNVGRQMEMLRSR
ncbi:hypothetical protein SAMN05421874_12884 [Nonomuraea maritima]|uniref:Uncharacterized protein n=1 Tax=Nonomuraea maritima TaxID=683260 RepID=A0A1G9MKX6_9ACTN|nr:hypothetical protein [Nonomuraea maritima]SDL74922.1 hypothetical protein SAMN05421874_12884 [Nonomuraea maritima]